MKNVLLNLINDWLLRGADARIVRASELYPWQLYPWEVAKESAATPNGTQQQADDILSYLVPDNPRLAELRARYEGFDPIVTTPLVWVDDILTPTDLKQFRGDNAYVYQLRGQQFNEFGYGLTTYYTLSASEGQLLTQASEDGAFGAYTLDVGGRTVSRDLLDSVREIDFLLRHVACEDRTLRVLDIGAGYGRLPHRLTEVLGRQVQVYATDAFPHSTFLSEFYLRYRNSPAEVIPLDEFDAFIGGANLDVAVNVHSFSECTAEAIEWWVSRLARHNVPNLMVIPNGEAKDVFTTCRTNDGQDMEAIFARRGYHCVVREHRYADPIVRQYGIDPAQISLFRLG